MSFFFCCFFQKVFTIGLPMASIRRCRRMLFSCLRAKVFQITPAAPKNRTKSNSALETNIFDGISGKFTKRVLFGGPRERCGAADTAMHTAMGARGRRRVSSFSRRPHAHLPILFFFFPLPLCVFASYLDRTESKMSRYV